MKDKLLANRPVPDGHEMNHNTLLLTLFIDVFGIRPYFVKNQNYAKELILYGIMAA